MYMYFYDTDILICFVYNRKVSVNGIWICGVHKETKCRQGPENVTTYRLGRTSSRTQDF